MTCRLMDSKTHDMRDCITTSKSSVLSRSPESAESSKNSNKNTQFLCCHRYYHRDVFQTLNAALLITQKFSQLCLINKSFLIFPTIPTKISWNLVLVPNLIQYKRRRPIKSVMTSYEWNSILERGWIGFVLLFLINLICCGLSYNPC